ncbi:hypothetical protein M3Y99_00701900 [Aphelenchoides fujianensis]|nr:hypothetical protein M3Y99_00701900 [Aphelenchoides fujianensis]
MAPSCEHSDSLSDIHSVEYGGVDVESSKCDLSFRPGTKLSLVLTKKPEREAPRVKIAIEGSTENLRGKIWYPSEKDGEIDTTHSNCSWNVQLNTEYRVPLALKHRVFCKVWTDNCPLCKADAEQKADYEEVFQTFLSQLKQSENRLSEQRLQAKNLQKALESRIRQLKQAAVDNERKLAEVLQENETLKEENKGMRSQVFNFKHKEERQNAKIWECINHERMDGGQPPPRSPVDNAEGHFDSSSSSGWEPVDAN